MRICILQQNRTHIKLIKVRLQIPKLNGTCRSIQKILMPASNKNVVQKKCLPNISGNVQGYLQRM